jgi:quercetin dioxygenase-like cupin family protein
LDDRISTQESRLISLHEKNQLHLLPSTEPIRLRELVDYQDGSVVSRTIITDKCGTITLFAFDQGEGLSEHTSPFNALVQILEGKAEIFISGKRMEASEGQIVMLPADNPHSLNAPSKFKMLLTMIRSG